MLCSDIVDLTKDIVMLFHTKHKLTMVISSNGCYPAPFLAARHGGVYWW